MPLSAKKPTLTYWSNTHSLRKNISNSKEAVTVKRPIDTDKKQLFIDNIHKKNGYFLDDRFVLKDGKRHPFAVICPGGGYEMIASFIEGVPIAKSLNKCGISAFIVYYRVGESAAYPAPMDDLAKAISAILAKAEQYRLITENYSVWGASAGGHLAASFGTQHMGYEKYRLPKPAAIVLMYPVVSMRKDLTHAGSRHWLIGEDATEDIARLTSIDETVTADYPPCYFWCGKNDKSVMPENSVRLNEALQNAGVRHSFTLYDNAPHGIGPGTGTDAQGWIEKAVRFWLEK